MVGINRPFSSFLLEKARRYFRSGVLGVDGVARDMGTVCGEVTKVANTSRGGALALPSRVAFSWVSCVANSLHSTGTKGRRIALEMEREGRKGRW